MKKSEIAITLVIIIALVAIVTGVWVYIDKSREQHNADTISEYEDLLKQSESQPIESAPTESSTINVSLTTMLESGIYTTGGVLQSSRLNDNQVAHYSITLNKKPLGIKAVSEIELTKAFLINGRQVILLGFDQGGNECPRKYQFVTIHESATQISKPFGSCLPLVSAVESDGVILLATPQNNPYLGDDFSYIYKYEDGDVKLSSKPNQKNLRNKYANWTALQIIKKAAADGCYQDGVLLEDGACGSGRKYCTIFKNLSKPVRDDNYKLLKEFCS